MHLDAPREIDWTHPLSNSRSSERHETQSSPRHRWFVLKEGFAPSLVLSAMGESEPDPRGLLFDPFAGSGTSPLVAAAIGMKSIGYEVNPFLAFAARTKQESCRPNSFQRVASQVGEGTRKLTRSPLEGISTFSEKATSRKWLFNRSVLRAFEGGWQASGGVNTPASQIARLCLIMAAMDVCNAYPDGKCLRYRRDWQDRKLNSRHFRTALELRFDHVLEDLRAMPNVMRPSVLRSGDARELALSEKSVFTVCVTSPPYLNSFDYTDIYRPHLFLGRFVQSTSDLAAIRKMTLRSHVQTSWKLPHGRRVLKDLDQRLELVRTRSSDLWDLRIPLMIQAYFEDWQTLLQQMRRLAAPGAKAWIIVSTSAYVGVEFPVDTFIAKIAANRGWKVTKLIGLRELRASGHHWMRYSAPEDQKPKLRETAVVLQAPS